ncbi:stage V sporulation protein AA [Paenibacillus marchantiophytorum]|uniref:Stage V sporulation protein AA n=1 Tax=Paenibacillus marchantiophytorum TaxID=1619310 RepID=A0ABQ1EVL2_9BACL|nr:MULTISPECIES: stage V sporulation protein AA [Paenibacillus]UKS30660.1 stage V sporulation protein AA [Paenibacillus sp. HWE-109]GFZ89295.1 stage V sporulation protein AA [Paenibacillus marchantiophytorum]
MVQNGAPYLYIRLRRKASVRKGNVVKLNQIAQIIVEPEYEDALNGLIIHKPQHEDGNRVLIDMMLIVRKVKNLFPELQIEHFGEPHVLLEIYSDNKKASPVLIGLVWLLLFIGSGLAIMNFHADVSMLVVHQRIYELMTGKKVEHPLILQIPYSLGIGVGMVIFFNHLFKKKFNEEPSPLEVEMFMYQENINHYVITEEYVKIHEEGETK